MARVRAALVVQLALLGDVLEIQRIRVGLVGVRRTVPHDDDLAARA